MTQSQKESPVHPVQAWLHLMRQFLERVDDYEHIPLNNLQLEFTCAARQLKLGWSLISHLKSLKPSPPSSDCSLDHQSRDLTRRKKCELFADIEPVDAVTDPFGEPEPVISALGPETAP